METQELEIMETTGSPLNLATTEWTPQHAEDLRRHERTISEGLQTFFEVGLALAAIRDGQLYRQDYRTFEDYLKDRWDYGRRYGYYLIDAGQTYKTVCTISAQPPANENQVRPLIGLEPDLQRTVWARATALARATGTKISGRIVEQALAAIEAEKADMVNEDGEYVTEPGDDPPSLPREAVKTLNQIGGHLEKAAKQIHHFPIKYGRVSSWSSGPSWTLFAEKIQDARRIYEAILENKYNDPDNG